MTTIPSEHEEQVSRELPHGSPAAVTWVFNPSIRLPASSALEGEVLESRELLLATLDSIQDGVSILDTDLTVRYVNNSMKYWYSSTGKLLGEKCHRVYHNREQPCENCPILNVISNKNPHIGIVKYTQGGLDRGWQELFAIPILDANDNLLGVLEYVRDISYQYKLEFDLNRIMEQYQSLEKRNSAISELLAQRKQEREQLEETIAHNFETFIRPSLNYLKAKSDVKEVDLVENLIEEIVYPLIKNRTSVLDKLTYRERQIAALIKEGQSSEEIARTLVVSKKTVDFHRANIRKKLGLNGPAGEKIHLMTYLASHM